MGQRTRSGVLAFCLTTCVMSVFLGATAQAQVVTASSVLKDATLAIAKQGSVHVLFVAHSGSPLKIEKITADVGTTSGTEAIVEGNAIVTIRLTTTDAYVSGDLSGLTTLFGMSSADAKKVGKDWESWKSGTGQYSNLKSDLTLSSVTALLPRVKGTELSTVVTDGAQLYVLKWTIPATNSLPKLSNTLTVSTGLLTLPVVETATASGGTKVTTTLSNWGERVSVNSPPVASTIASSKITG